jgi:hypothetical protein
MEKQVCK